LHYQEQKKKDLIMPQGHRKTKITSLQRELQKKEKKIFDLKEQLRSKNRECRGLRQRIKELRESRGLLDRKYKSLKFGEKKNRNRVGYKEETEVSDGVEGYKYSSKIMSLCILLHIAAGCSLRGTIKVLLTLQLELGLRLSEIPGKSSIDNWIRRLGYYEYNGYNSGMYPQGYALIIDESMVIGQQRMMVVLGLPAEKTGIHACKFDVVRLLYLSVKSSWKGSDIAELLEKVKEKMGAAPLYVISDGSSTLKKGIRDAGLLRIFDTGHEIGKFLEQEYKNNEAYNSFTKAAAAIKLKEVMKGTAYLLPPKQRSISRFMNICEVVYWGRDMIASLNSLTLEEQNTFKWLNEHKEIINELQEVFNTTHCIMKCLKNKGLSHCSIDDSLVICKKRSRLMPKSLQKKITNYLEEEKKKLPDDKTCWHASSDIIESMFGKFKSQMSTNKLNGVTPSVLKLCILTQFGENMPLIQEHIRVALPRSSRADLKSWADKHLVDNQVTKRIKTIKKVKVA
jgi:hypothetical protein